jgi:periplasmic protein TonB
MFEGVEAAGNDEGKGKGRFAASTGISIAVVVGLGGILAAVGTGVVAHETPDQQDLQVTFQTPAAPEPKVEEAPPPPPAPKEILKKRKNTQAATPTTLPGEALAEGNEADFQGAGQDAINDLTAPVEEEKPPEPPPRPAAPPPVETVVQRVERGDPAPVDMEDNEWIRPKADGGNAQPVYPEVARKKGLQGVVILRFLVTRDGRVTRISVDGGDEPFVSAAIAVVKTWRYQPGKLAGRPRDAWHKVRVPFQLHI